MILIKIIRGFISITRAQEELGYQPVITLDEGIEKTAAWLRDHGKLPR